MSISSEDVRRLAQLAALGIDEHESQRVAHQLNDVFKLIERMSAIDTQHIQPMSHPQDIGLRLRDDLVTATNQRDEFLRPAPKTEAGLFLVPRVIE